MAPPDAAVSANGQQDDASSPESLQGKEWTCAHCTFINEKPYAKKCCVCNQPRKKAKAAKPLKRVRSAGAIQAALANKRQQLQTPMVTCTAGSSAAAGAALSPPIHSISRA